MLSSDSLRCKNRGWASTNREESDVQIRHRDQAGHYNVGGEAAD